MTRQQFLWTSIVAPVLAFLGIKKKKNYTDWIYEAAERNARAIRELNSYPMGEELDNILFSNAEFVKYYNEFSKKIMEK